MGVLGSLVLWVLLTLAGFTIVIGCVLWSGDPVWPITKSQSKPPSLEDFEKWNDLHVQAVDDGMDEPEAVKFADQGLYTFKRMRGTTPPIGEVMREFYITPATKRYPVPQRPSPMVKTLR